MGDWICQQVTLCIVLKDAFTGGIIRDRNIKLLVNQKPPQIIKDEGYYLFRYGETKEINVLVHGGCYETGKRCIRLWENGKKRESGRIPGGFLSYTSGIVMVYLLLYPNEQYILPPGYKRKVIKDMDRELFVVADTKKYQFLLEDYQGGNMLSVKGESQIQGNAYRIIGADKNHEDFSVMEMPERNLLIIDRELEKTYKRGSRIYRLYCALPDEDGNAVVVVSF